MVAPRDSVPAMVAPKASPSAPGLLDVPARESAPAAAPSALTPPPPSLRTLFDAPAPEAISVVPPLASEACLAPIEPSRPGGTVVGPSPFDDESGEIAPPPLPLPAAGPSGDVRQSGPRPTAAILANPGGRAVPPRAPDLDWSDDSTIQGATTEPAPRGKRRSRTSRAVAIIALGAVAALSAVGFAQYLANAPSSEQAGSVDELVEQARECSRMRSWDSPPGANVKEITTRALELSPNEPRIVDLRRDAAEKIVTEALGRKYAGNRDDAMRLAKLALEMNPELTTAQHLVAELEEEGAVAAAASGVAPAAEPPDAKTSEPIVASAKPKLTGKLPLPPATSPPPTKGTGSAVAPSRTSKPSTPPPTGTGAAVLPPPTNTGPWL